jgi:hypothetical protein
MDSDPKTIAKDAAIGGFAGLISMGVGGLITSSIRAGAAGMLSKLSPFFQKFLPLSFGGGAAGATDSAIWDKLKNGAVNWKNALLSAAIGIGLVFGAGQLIEKAPSIISQINKLPANHFEQLSPALAFEGGGSSVSKTIGDTGFGQWLRKFASGSNISNVPQTHEELLEAVRNYRLHSNIRNAVDSRGRVVKLITYADGTEKRIYNSHLANQNHPRTGVPFNSDGFPIFNNWAKGGDFHLSSSQYLDSDAQQFRFLTQQLARRIESNPSLAGQFTSEQLVKIRAGSPNIPGLTWHHHQEPGRMQLVPTNIHSRTSHTGGRSIWGGGNSYR